ncbi:Uncharacterised protein [Mycobacteroides abscessus subsp. abscessus]|nr:Uncharacterised protein [Mycobacteroides abscessus subsp. abscessus]
MVRGGASRCPASSTPLCRPFSKPARTKATCSLTIGAFSSAARAARCLTRLASGRSAPASPKDTPCGTTTVPASRRRVSSAGSSPGRKFSATISVKARLSESSVTAP